MSTGSFQARRAIYQSQHGEEPQPGAGQAPSSIGADAVAAPSRRITSVELRDTPSHVSERGAAAMNAR